MFFQTHSKKICLFYILVLFLWGTISATTSASEMGDVLGDACECYVNHSSSVITPMGKTFPTQEYLSARNFGAQETVSAARGRNIKPLPRSLRNIAAALCSGSLLSDTSVCFGRTSEQEIPSFCLCSIIITNYIHHQDGQKV